MWCAGSYRGGAARVIGLGLCAIVTASSAGARARPGAPAQPTVIVDGQAAGKAPLGQAIVVRPGPHRLRIQKPGFRSAADDVTVQAGQRVPRAFTLAPIEVAAAAGGAAGEGTSIDLRT